MTRTAEAARGVAVRFVERLVRRLGYELVGIGVLPPAGAEMPVSSLKMSDGVKLVSLRVWTEGESECKHDYRKVRAMNSHKNAVSAALGKQEHFDYTCSKCTHRVCSSDWGGANV